MSLRYLNPFEILKASTLALLAILLFSLGSATHPTSLAAYLSFSAIMMLQGIEMLAPVFSEKASDLVKRTLLLRLSISTFFYLIRSSLAVLNATAQRSVRSNLSG